jgi:hypothetical protein
MCSHEEQVAILKEKKHKLPTNSSKYLGVEMTDQ